MELLRSLLNFVSVYFYKKYLLTEQRIVLVFLSYVYYLIHVLFIVPPTNLVITCCCSGFVWVEAVLKLVQCQYTSLVLNSSHNHVKMIQACQNGCHPKNTKMTKSQEFGKSKKVIVKNKLFTYIRSALILFYRTLLEYKSTYINKRVKSSG